MVTTNPLDAVAELQAIVKRLAPNVQPQVLPKGSRYGLDVLLALCVTDKQKEALHTLVTQQTPKSATDALPYVTGALDVEKKVFAIEKLQWLTREQALIHEFPRFLELQLREPQKAEKIISAFLKANGHRTDDVLAAQQAFNAAFALQTILRAFPRPQIAIGGNVVDVNEQTDISDVVAPLFPSLKQKKQQQQEKPAATKKAGKSKKRKAQ
ncbi:hypothetical protein Poli38472_008582 [Pythium oligandrum]|uniref:Uncharacterized protein n=1 Tax=Pythium oligandrum TaxID=41045 RepID=A0A8K1FCL1_PYTOL|nr:hypothetical protein Poli38472_008582 [Pythium oligandrum]|eukprot:TMW55934.1 hypothetical protein Poli38472_008582 [Pythium oligandrum]